MKLPTAPFVVFLKLYLLAAENFFLVSSQKRFFLRVGCERVFTHTGMALGKADPMIKDLII